MSALPVPQEQTRPLHRLREVRQREGFSRRTVARQLGVSVREVYAAERSADLRLSELYAWQQVLEVPMHELLAEEEDSLSLPQQRAGLIKLMRTIRSLQELAPSRGPFCTMLENLVNQLLEIMPELKDAPPWPHGGQPRSLAELGRTGEHPTPVPIAIRAWAESIGANSANPQGKMADS